MKLKDTYTSPEHGYSLGVETVFGRFYLSIPKGDGGSECFEITQERYEAFLADPALALRFAEAARRGERDRRRMFGPHGD
ncbi:hypothetical protein [Glycomyces artemisiae]|uniref:Uncharacterized protein n=1 Tax=Glycomyces artemisiae TaxID=1076443 RepID=A0A2T0UVJ6_9ACTN|nr:hypothetical protein [Glycomyces artemisiae]PRY61924.1 hypothetical protein B0I28_101248 [Glycomyces artemisiae]